MNKSSLFGNSCPVLGGAIYNIGLTLTVNQCTIVSNTALALGGGIFNDPNSTLTVNHSTFCGNTVGGVCRYQLALPFLADQDPRCILENARFFYHRHRTSSGALEYFGGRDNNGGDGYLDRNKVALMNTAIARAIASGNLPSFPTANTTRLYARMTTP